MNTTVELRNITNDTGKSSKAQKNASMTKFNAYLQLDYSHLRLPADVNWSTLRIVELQHANTNFLSDIFGRFGHYLFEHANIKWKTADQYLSALKKHILTRMTSKSIDLQDIVINTLKEIGCKQNNKAPYFWSTYKMFESNKLFVHSDNYYN